MSSAAKRLSKSWSLPTRGAWIEMLAPGTKMIIPVSLPTRGAWIEILIPQWLGGQIAVAPHTGSVD